MTATAATLSPVAMHSRWAFCVLFARDVGRRLNRRLFGYTALFGWLFSLIHHLSLLTSPRINSLHGYLVLDIPINLGAAFCLLLALICGDSAVAFGARSLRAYLIPLAISAVAFSLLQWQLRHWLGIETQADHAGAPIALRHKQIWFVALQMLSVAGTVAFVYVNRQRAVQGLRLLQAARLERAEVEKAIVRWRLQTMQAQIEPQLLSDTLRSVKQLYETDAQRADALLDELIQYLRSALPQLRGDTSTLGREVSLASAYVNILMALRGDRLSCEIEIAASLASAALPPMLLLPLVAQATRLGIEAKPPTACRLLAEVIDGHLHVLIEFQAAQQATEQDIQPPLDVVERLRSLYETRANLQVERVPPDRLRYRLSLPYEPG